MWPTKMLRRSFTCTRLSAHGEGKVAVVTGANSGIGRETVRALGEKGYEVVLACRNINAGLEAKAEVEKLTGIDAEKLSVLPCDLNSLKSVKDFAETYREKYDKCDVLVNNAGVMMIPELTLTEDGFEQHLGVNYLGHFLLTSLLLKCLKKSSGSRVVNVSSAANSFGKFDFDNMNFSRGYDAWQAYGNSKLGNLMFTLELDRRLKSSGIENVKTNAVHPGLVATNLGRYMNPFSVQFLKLFSGFFVLTPEQGAKAQIALAMSDKYTGVSGKYFADQTFKFNPGHFEEEDRIISPFAKNKTIAEKLWNYSSDVTGAEWQELSIPK